MFNYKSITGKWYRLIASTFPPIALFEQYFEEPDELEIAFEIEGLTNDRLLEETGDLFLVPKEDWVRGFNASFVMGAFTHIGRKSRFTNGEFYGLYYAASSVKTAIKETMFHHKQRLLDVDEEDVELTMRCISAEVCKDLVDISVGYQQLHNPDSYIVAQEFGQEIKDLNEWGIYYNSLRDLGNYCISIFRPPALKNVKQNNHYKYYWSKEKKDFSSCLKLSLVKL